MLSIAFALLLSVASAACSALGFIAKLIMRVRAIRTCLAGLFGLALASVAFSETPAEVRVRIMEQTKLVAVQGLSVPAAQYTGDGDPTTLEIVFLDRKSDGPSRVSDDGEVIFLYKASDKLQQELIGKAFDIRVTRTLNGA